MGTVLDAGAIPGSLAVLFARDDAEAAGGRDATPLAAVVDDQALLAAIARGDEAALGALYDRHGAAALGLAGRIVGDRRAAEEVVQDVFVAVWRRAGSYDPARGAPRSWLLRVVHNRAIDRLRGRARGDEVDIALVPEVADRADVWAEVEARLSSLEIRAAVSRLPAPQREAIELGFFGGLTHVEIAARLGDPIGTVKGRIRLGLARLAGLLASQAELA